MGLSQRRTESVTVSSRQASRTVRAQRWLQPNQLLCRPRQTRQDGLLLGRCCRTGLHVLSCACGWVSLSLDMVSMCVGAWLMRLRQGLLGHTLDFAALSVCDVLKCSFELAGLSQLPCVHQSARAGPFPYGRLLMCFPVILCLCAAPCCSLYSAVLLSSGTVLYSTVRVQYIFVYVFGVSSRGQCPHSTWEVSCRRQTIPLAVAQSP